MVLVEDVDVQIVVIIVVVELDVMEVVNAEVIVEVTRLNNQRAL